MSALGSIRGDRPVAFVTGGAKRVGRAICSALGRAGCDVVFTFRGSADEAATLTRELKGVGAGAEAMALELGDLSEVERFGARLAREARRLDVLVHNASVYSATPISGAGANAIGPEEFLTPMRINAAAPLLLTTALAGRLAESPQPGGGAVVAMCDIHAMGRPRPGFAAYAMSKAALVEMVYSLARELAPRVRVNGVAPGVVAFAEQGQDADPEMRRKYLSRVPLERSGTPEDAAEAVRWLALEARYTTGQVIRVDGGRWLT